MKKQFSDKEMHFNFKFTNDFHREDILRLAISLLAAATVGITIYYILKRKG